MEQIPLCLFCEHSKKGVCELLGGIVPQDKYFEYNFEWTCPFFVMRNDVPAEMVRWIKSYRTELRKKHKLAKKQYNVIEAKQ